MMKIFKVGDSQKAICESCGSLENATFALRDVPFSDGSGMVKNVLVGVCDRCDEVSVLPHQSMPVVKKQLEEQRKPIESRVPAHMLDILNLASAEIGVSPDFVPYIMKFYIHGLAADEKAARNMANYMTSELATGKAEKRLSLKGRKIYEDLSLLKAISNISSTTELIKSIILKINDDILVKKKPSPIKQLKNIAAAVA
ncbi:hypothetical protein ACVBEJ_12945 [Porticoccus sp. GXU_MW_L64]